MNVGAGANLEVGGIILEAQRLALAALPSLVTYVTVLTIGGILVDMADEMAGANLMFSLASLILTYWFVNSMLQSGGLAPDGLKGGFGTYFGLSLLSGIGIALGIVVLIIPGIILMVRWAPIYGFGLVEGEGVSDAFSRSWQATRQHFTSILGVTAIPIALFAIGFAIYFVSSVDMGAVEFVPSAIANLVMSVAGIMIAAIGIAVYSLLRDATSELIVVFE